MQYVPRQYQLIGRDFLKSRKYALLGDACGVGKTGQAILAMDRTWKTLIVCPASVKLQWQTALKDWINQESFVVNTSRDKVPFFSGPVIINYDLLIKEDLLKRLLQRRFDLIIYDEAHKLKSLTAKRTKVALNTQYLRPRSQRIWFLTGTPVKNRTIDLFPILKSCAPEVLGPYSSYYKFAYRFCGAYTGRFGLDVSGASHTEELRERLKSFMLRREKRDVLLELPPRVVSKIDLECTPAVKKVIEEEELKTIEQSGESDPTLFKLGEIARIRQAIARYKVPVSVDYIKDLLEEEEKLVVFYYHREVLNDLRRAFTKIPSVYVDGTVAGHKRRGIVENFTKRKEVRLFFGQMGACGEGIDGLQTACSCCVFVEPSWSHTDLEQCIGRLERSGQRNDVNVHILTIKDTLEARMMNVVAMKLNVDKKLYNQKEQKMVKRGLELVLTKETAAINLANALKEFMNAYVSEGAVVEMPTPVEVQPEVVETEVTEDSIRARAADICSIAPDGTGKTKCAEIIKKLGGGKIADLKKPEQRKKCLAALDALYNEISEGL